MEIATQFSRHVILARWFFLVCGTGPCTAAFCLPFFDNSRSFSATNEVTRAMPTNKKCFAYQNIFFAVFTSSCREWSKFPPWLQQVVAFVHFFFVSALSGASRDNFNSLRVLEWTLDLESSAKNRVSQSQFTSFHFVFVYFANETENYFAFGSFYCFELWSLDFFFVSLIELVSDTD